MNGRKFVTGALKFGAIIGLIWWLPTNIVFYAVLDGSSSSEIFVDGIWHIFEEGIAGAALGLVYGGSGPRKSLGRVLGSEGSVHSAT
jgi:hypothetical protein